MGAHDDAVAAAGQLDGHVHEPLVVGVVEVCRRLVHHKELCRLADGAGDDGELPLPAAQRGVFLVRKVRDVHLLKRGEGCVPVRLLWGLEGGEMRRAAHHDHVEHRVGKHGRVVLGDVGRELGQLAGLERADIPPVEPYRAAAAAEHAEQQTEESRFPAAVRADEAEDLPGVRRAGDALHYVPGAVAAAEVFNFEQHGLTPAS